MCPGLTRLPIAPTELHTRRNQEQLRWLLEGGESWSRTAADGGVEGATAVRAVEGATADGAMDRGRRQSTDAAVEGYRGLICAPSRLEMRSRRALRLDEADPQLHIHGVANPQVPVRVSHQHHAPNHSEKVKSPYVPRNAS